MRLTAIFPLIAALALPALASAQAPAKPVSCHVGMYRMADGRWIDLSPRSDGDLRWRTLDGKSGRLSEGADGRWTAKLGWTETIDPTPVRFGACSEGRFSFGGVEGRRMDFTVREARFTSGDVTLFGKLVMPPGDGPVPVVIEVHGSEKDAATVFNFKQRMWPAEGVGVFVYDKRGTGQSTGTYTQDFPVLAGDAAAALEEARRLAGPRVARIGYYGGSQGGWVAPLAALKAKPDFVMVGFGLADTALAEDRDQVMLDLIAKGHGPDVLAKAREVTDATGEIIASKFQDGWERLAELKARYGHEPWFKDLKGEFTGEIVHSPPEAVKAIGPSRDEGTSWRYDPMPTLRATPAPILWALAGEDLQAPVAETRRRLLALNAEGLPITVVEFPNTDHGITTFTVGPDGKRTTTGYASGWLRLILDGAWGRPVRPGAYGDALVTPARAKSTEGASAP